MKILEEMACDILIDAISIENIFGEDKICLTGRTPVGDTIANDEDGIVSFSVDLDKTLFASSTEAAPLIGVRERNIHPFSFKKMTAVGIEGDFREMVSF